MGREGSAKSQDGQQKATLARSNENPNRKSSPFLSLLFQLSPKLWFELVWPWIWLQIPEGPRPVVTQDQYSLKLRRIPYLEPLHVEQQDSPLDGSYLKDDETPFRIPPVEMPPETPVLANLSFSPCEHASDVEGNARYPRGDCPNGG